MKPSPANPFISDIGHKQTQHLDFPAKTVSLDILAPLVVATSAVVPLPLVDLVATLGTLVVDVLPVVEGVRHPAARATDAECVEAAPVTHELVGVVPGLVLDLGLDLFLAVGAGDPLLLALQVEVLAFGVVSLVLVGVLRGNFGRFLRGRARLSGHDLVGFLVVF